MSRASRALLASGAALAAVLAGPAVPALADDPTPSPAATPEATATPGATPAASPDAKPSLFLHVLQPGPTFAPAPVVADDADFAQGLPTDGSLLTDKEVKSGARLDVDNLGNKLDDIAAKLDKQGGTEATSYSEPNGAITALSLLGLPVLGGAALVYVVLASRRRRNSVGGVA